MVGIGRFKNITTVRVHPSMSAFGIALTNSQPSWPKRPSVDFAVVTSFHGTVEVPPGAALLFGSFSSTTWYSHRVATMVSAFH